MQKKPADGRAKRTAKNGSTVAVFMQRKINSIMNNYLKKNFVTFKTQNATVLTASCKTNSEGRKVIYLSRDGSIMSSRRAIRKIRSYKSAITLRLKYLLKDNLLDVKGKSGGMIPPKLSIRYSSDSELGVYAEEEIERGRLIGYYCGTYHRTDCLKEEQEKLKNEQYILQVAHGYIDGSPWKFTHPPEAKGFVCSLINSAPVSKCNCRFIINFKDPKPELMKSVRIVSTKRISKDEQLLIDYGRDYFTGGPKLL